MVDKGQANLILERLTDSPSTGAVLRKEAMRELSKIPGYDWVGIYRLEEDGLHLNEFVGASTEHTLIPIGTGVCGTAVKERRNQIVTDVRWLRNYLACSVKTRSEIVVLIYSRYGNILGQIDADSHTIGAFDRSDERLLEDIGDILASHWE